MENAEVWYCFKMTRRAKADAALPALERIFNVHTC